MNIRYLAIMIAACALFPATQARDFNVTISMPDSLSAIVQNPLVSETALILGALYITPIATKVALSGTNKIFKAASGINQKLCSAMGLSDAVQFIKNYQYNLTQTMESDELAVLAALGVFIIEFGRYLARV